MDGTNGINGFSQVEIQPNNSLVSAQGQGKIEGQLSGMTVELEDPLSALMDNAEELTFARDNSKRTKLADRKQRDASSLYLVKQAALFAEIVTQVQNADYEARKRILSNASSYKDNHKQLLKDLNKLGGKKVYDFVAIQSAYAEEKNPEIKQLLKQASDDLFSNNKSEILATLNVLKVSQEDESLGSASELSESYSELTNSCGTDALKMMDYISEKFGETRFNDGVEYMLKALGADLSSPITSQEQVLLESIGSSLSTVRMLNSAKNICQKFTSRLENVHNVLANTSSSAIISGLLNLSKQKIISGSDIRNLYNNVSQQKPDKEVLMAQDFLSMCRELGSEFFDDNSARTRIIDAAISLVDDTISAEDQWLENGGI